MAQESLPKSPSDEKSSGLNTTKAGPQDTSPGSTSGSFNSTGVNVDIRGSDEGLPSRLTIKNTMGKRTSDSMANTIDDSLSELDVPLSPTGFVSDHNTAINNLKKGNRFFGSQNIDIDRSGPASTMLGLSTIVDRTVDISGTTQQFQSKGFKVLTQEELEQAYDSRSSREKEFNISDSTLTKLSNIAQIHQTVIITRPVNPTALTLIKNVDAVGKNMFVHGKSALEDSLAAGFITVNAGSSKAGKDDNEDKIKAANVDNHESLANSKKKFLEIQEKLMKVAKGNEGLTGDQLLQKAKIAPEEFDQMVFAAPVLDKKGNQIYVFEHESGSGVVAKAGGMQVHAVEENGKMYFIDRNHNHISVPTEVTDRYKKIPLKVIGKPEIIIGTDGSLSIGKVKPITADIDVLAYGSKANLPEFDQMLSYQRVVTAEKEKLVQSKIATLNLDKKTVDALVNHEIGHALKRSDLITDSLKKNEEFRLLANELKSIETNRANLKGMGSAPEFGTAITNIMRAEFKDSAEISHNSEQFNIDFTQPLDNKWVLIDSKGKVSTISGEKELLETFSKFKAEGLSIPPNPNWGWELKEGKYEQNKDLVKISSSCQHLCLKKKGWEEELKTLPEGAKDEINKKLDLIAGILKLQTEVGIMAITEPKDDSKLAKHIQDLKNQIKKCHKEEILTENDMGQIQKSKEARSKIYDLTHDARNVTEVAQEYSRNIAEAVKEYSNIPKSLTATLDGTLRTGNKQTLTPIVKKEGSQTDKDLKTISPLALSTRQNTGKLEQRINTDLKREILYVAEKIRANLARSSTNSPSTAPNSLQRSTSRGKDGGRGI